MIFSFRTFVGGSFGSTVKPDGLETEFRLALLRSVEQVSGLKEKIKTNASREDPDVLA